MSPDLGADVLIRAAAAGLADLTDTGRTRMLTRAFDLASQAREPFGRVGRMPGMGEGRARYIALSAGTGVNRLSLQCRAIRATVPTNPADARRMLEQIEMPAVTPASCRDPLIADVSEYYDTARLVLKHPDASGRLIVFLTRVVERIQSPVQLAPAARLLAQVEVSRAGLRNLVGLYSNILRNIRGGDPAFRYAAVNQRLEAEIEALARKCGASSEVAEALLAAFREFILTHLTGLACHQSFLPPAREEIRTTLIEPYNARLGKRGVLTREGAPPLDLDELWPSDADNARPEVQAFWQSGEAEVLWARLTGGDADSGASASQETGLAAMPELAYRLSQWQRPEEMPEEAFFHQKLMLYERLARAASASALRREAVDGSVALLAGSPMESRAPAEWLLRLIALVRDGELREDVLGAMQEAADPALRSYAELERRVPLRVEISGIY